MKTIFLVAFAACGVLSADPLNGITYTWHYLDGYTTAYGLVIVTDFSAPVNTYTFHIDLPTSVVDPVIHGGDQTIWMGTSAEVSGTMPTYLTDKTTLTIDVSWAPNTGGSAVNGFYYTSLTAASDPPADAPEPAAFILTGLGISALALARQWTSRNSKPGASRLRALAVPVSR